MIGALAVGCNRDTEDPTPTPPTENDPIPPTPPAPPEDDNDIEVPELDPELGYDGVTNFRIVPEGETTTISVFYAHGGLGTILPEQANFVAAADMTGVVINNVANPNIPEGDEAFMEMILSGNIPELIHSHISNLEIYVDEGLFMDISDIIFAYAPNIVKYFNYIPATRVASTHHDGGIYILRAALIGAGSPNPQPSKMFFIRHDWLAELNLPVPETFEQFRATLEAFRDNNMGDPNSQTFPFFARQADIRTILQLWGVRGDWANWYIEDGRVGHGMLSEAYRDALIELAEWYADGLIDPEIFTRGGLARQELLASNQGGVAVDWPGSTGALNYNDAMREAVPTLDWRYMRIPANIHGEVRSEWGRGSVAGFGWGVAAGTSRERAIEIVQFMDFWFSDPGAQLYSFGVEGYSFEYVNGQPQFLPHAFEHEGGIPNFIRTLGSQSFPAWPADIAHEVDNFFPSVQEGYWDHLNNVQTFDPLPPFAYLPHETTAINSVDGSFIEEFRQGAILGTIDVAVMWDAYIEQAHREGLFEAMAAIQSAYDRFRAAAGN